VYKLKVAFKHNKNLWQHIEIRDDQTLGDLDEIVRKTFGHDTWDHLSEFFPDQSCRSGFGEINPHGGGPGADIVISSLNLHEGIKIGYVYDFGDWIEHVLTLEEIKDVEKKFKYPRIPDKGKTKKRRACPRRDGNENLSSYGFGVA